MTKAIEQNYIKFYKGNAPIILSAPHGGTLKPKTIRCRKKGVFDIDAYTFDLTERIAKEFYKKTGLTPYVAIAQISRTKVDINRDEEEAFEDEKARIPYDAFHDFLQNAREEVERKFGRGLYIDIHGQSHPNGYLEFGYLLKNEILKLHDSELKHHVNNSSIQTLSKFSKHSFVEQLRGPLSMGSLMTNLGFDSIPSTKLPFASDDNYFEGAYNTFKYGSLDGENINGIQIEFPYKGARDTSANRQRCAEAFVESLLKFLDVHYGFDLKAD